MRKKPIILSISIVVLLILIVYVAIFSHVIDNSLLFMFIIIGSLSVVTTSTIYTVVTHNAMEDDRIRDINKFKKSPSKIKEMSIKKKVQGKLIDEYLDAIPSIREYIKSEKNYEEIPVLDKLIFSKFDPEILRKIDLLNLSKMDRLEFIRELVYFDPEERESLIENMLIHRDKSVGEVNYVAPSNPISLMEKIRVHVISLIESGQKMKVMIVESTDVLGDLKEKIALLFGYSKENFLLSSGGIILKEDYRLNDYYIADDDEIVLIPTRKK